MDHHGLDGGAMAPETAAAGPGGAGDGAGGPGAGNGGAGAVAGRVRPDATPGSAGAGITAADRVWEVLLTSIDPLGVKELTQAAGVSRIEAVEAVLTFVTAGYVLSIPAVRGSYHPHPDLWVLAGGVREELGVADAIRAGLLEKLAAAPPPAHPEADTAVVWRAQGEVAPPVPVGEVTGIPVLPRGGMPMLVLEVLVAEWPGELGVLGISQRIRSRSLGAVRRAAEELCDTGMAVCTDPAVKRYAALRPDALKLATDEHGENLA